MMIKCSEGEKSDYNLKLYIFNGKVMVNLYWYLPIPVKFYFTPFYRLQFKFTPIKKLTCISFHPNIMANHAIDTVVHHAHLK